MPLKLTDIFKGSSEEEILSSLENFKYDKKSLSRGLKQIKKQKEQLKNEGKRHVPLNIFFGK
jgi:hypothetical protein